MVDREIPSGFTRCPHPGNSENNTRLRPLAQIGALPPPKPRRTGPKRPAGAPKAPRTPKNHPVTPATPATPNTPTPTRTRTPGAGPRTKPAPEHRTALQKGTRPGMPGQEPGTRPGQGAGGHPAIPHNPHRGHPGHPGAVRPARDAGREGPPGTPGGGPVKAKRPRPGAGVKRRKARSGCGARCFPATGTKRGGGLNAEGPPGAWPGGPSSKMVRR